MREIDLRRCNQKEFAKILGISSAYLSEILSGKKSGQQLALNFLIKLKLLSSSSTTLTDTRYYPYNDHNREIHDDVEIILTCGDNSIINSFIMLLKGVMLTVKEGSEQVKLLRKVANGQEALLDVVKSFPGGGAGDEDASHASPKIVKHL